MANKFQKSVEKRMEQESAGKQMVSAEKKDLSVKKKAAVPTGRAKGEKSNVLDVAACFSGSKKRKAKNRTYYLDEEVILEVERQAAKYQTTNSDFVNTILRQALGVTENSGK